MAKMKAGIIGCGKRGRLHAQGYQASDDVLPVLTLLKIVETILPSISVCRKFIRTTMRC